MPRVPNWLQDPTVLNQAYAMARHGKTNLHFLQHVAISFNGWVYWIIYRKPSFRRPLARNFCDVMRPRDDGDRHLCCRLGAVQRWFIDQERKLPLTEPTGSVGFFLWYPRDQKISWLAETWTMAKCHPEIIILIIFIFLSIVAEVWVW